MNFSSTTQWQIKHGEEKKKERSGSILGYDNMNCYNRLIFRNVNNLTQKKLISYLCEVLPEVGEGVVEVDGSATQTVIFHLYTWHPQLPWSATCSKQTNRCWGWGWAWESERGGPLEGFYGPGLEVEYITSAHIPSAQIQAYDSTWLHSKAGKLAMCRRGMGSGFGEQPTILWHG